MPLGISAHRAVKRSEGRPGNLFRSVKRVRHEQTLGYVALALTLLFTLGAVRHTVHVAVWDLGKRDSAELADLIEIIGELADSLSREGNWRVKHVGRADILPAELARVLAEAEERTRDHTGLHVNLAVGYGGRNEIVDAVRSILAQHDASGGTLEDLAANLTPEMIGEHLYTGGQPDPDLVIRTSGEQRLSDFLLWQSAHSEFYFVEALGPDLRQVDFLRAVRDYADRDRRFGR